MGIPTTPQLNGCKTALTSLIGQLDEQSAEYVGGMIVREIAEELNVLQLNADGLNLPIPDLSQYYSHKSSGEDRYFRRSLRSMLGRILARLDAALIDRAVEKPSDMPTAFPFISDGAIRIIVERDYRELQRAAFATCAKAQLVLAGSCIEGILYDLLTANTIRLAEVKPPPRNSQIDSWTLGELIRVCVSLKLVSPGIEKLAPGLRDYRNLIHPAAEVRERIVPGIHEAEIAAQILHILRRDLAG